jgi:aspartate/methionine/tyrosine aminotransferase
MKSFSGLKPNDILPYAPSYGKPDLRKKWREDMVRKNPSLSGASISLPIVTSGITHGLSLVGDLFINPGDVILLPDMYWGNYNMIFSVRRGAKIVRHTLFTSRGKLDTNSLSQELLQHSTCGKIIVILNFPNNPTGYSITKSEAMKICAALIEAADNGCNIVAVCDDAYFGLFYEEDVYKESIFGLLSNRHKRILAVKLDAATKEDYVWGFRVGFLTYGIAGGAPELYESLEKKTAGAVRGNISNCPGVSQEVVLRAMGSKTYIHEKQKKYDILKARALKVKEVLKDKRFSSAWTPYPFNSGYFMCLKMKNLKAEAFRLRLLDKYGIGVIAADERDIRIAFSCIEEKDVCDLFEQMWKCAEEMKKADRKSRTARK